MGFFIHMPPYSGKNGEKDLNMVIVRRWDEELQAFVKLEASEEVAYQEGVLNMDFDSNLGAYPLDNHHQWVYMTDYID